MALEVKWDGIRAQLRFDGRCVSIRSRPGRNCTAEFPQLAELHEMLASRKIILDGEGVGEQKHRRCEPRPMLVAPPGTLPVGRLRWWSSDDTSGAADGSGLRRA
ncbi:MAG: hypothetical protein JO046_04225 [Solirubrobacterales bacterium]|nr:hypothetical protein [Solirubrobacterales bacterium]